MGLFVAVAVGVLLGRGAAAAVVAAGVGAAAAVLLCWAAGGAAAAAAFTAAPADPVGGAAGGDGGPLSNGTLGEFDVGPGETTVTTWAGFADTGGAAGKTAEISAGAITLGGAVVATAIRSGRGVRV